jgi:uncharacterized membrane protein
MPTVISAIIVAAAVLLAIVARLLYGRSGVIPGSLLIIACLGFFALVTRLLDARRGVLTLLIVGAGITRYTVTLFGLSLKVEHVAVIVGVVIAGIGIIRRRETLRLDLPAILLISWLVLNFVAGLINAPSPFGSLKLAALLALAMGAYFVVTQLVTNRKTLVFTFSAALAAGIGVAAYGLLAHLVFPFGPDLGVQINPITKTPTVYSTQWEGNIFGGFCAAIAIIILAARLTTGIAWPKRRLEWGLLIALIALEVSLARGAWLAIAGGIGALAFGIALLWRRHSDMTAIAPLRWMGFVPLLLVVSFIIWLNPLLYIVRYVDWGTGLASAPLITYTEPVRVLKPSTAPTQPNPTTGASGAQPSVAPAAPQASPPSNLPVGNNPSKLGARVQSTGDVSDPTYNQRRQTLVRATRDALKHPLIGWGPGTYGQKYINTSWQPDWIPTLSVRVLHDTGFLGVVFFHGALLLIGWRAWRTLWRPLDPELRSIIFATLVGIIVLGAAYEVTEAIQFTFFWILAGVIVAGVRLATTEQLRPDSTRIFAFGPLGTVAFDRFRLTTPSKRSGPLPAGVMVATKPATRRSAIPQSFHRLRTSSGAFLPWLSIGIVGLALTLYRLGRRGFSTDEIRVVAWQTGVLSATVRTTADFPLYPALAGLATRLYHSELAARTPAVLFAVITAFALYVLGQQLFNKRVAFIAALGLLITPTFVWQAQEASPYTGLACGSLLMLACWCALIQRPLLRTWGAFTIIAILGLLNHLLAIIPIIGIISLSIGHIIAVKRARARTFRILGMVVLSSFIAIIGTLPLLIPPLRFIVRGGTTTATLNPVNALNYLGAGAGWPTIVFAALLLIGVGFLINARAWMPLAIVGVWLLVPLVAAVVLNGRYPFDERYLILVQPVYVLIISYGLVTLGEWLAKTIRNNQPAWASQNAPAIFAGALLAITLLPPTVASYQVRRAFDWSAACKQLRPLVSVGDRFMGDEPTAGLVSWCFGPQPAVSFTSPNAKSLELVGREGRNTFYITLANTIDKGTLVQRGFEQITIIKGAGTPSNVQNRRSLFNQPTETATLYYYRAPDAPARVVFDDIPGGGATPSYAQVGPGQDRVIALALPITAPRIVRLTIFDLSGRDLQVYANDELLKDIKAGASGGKWTPFDLALPSSVGANFTLRIHGSGSDTGAFSEVQVVYATR